MQADEIITGGNCHKESKISRVKFRLELLDATTKCSGCKKNLPVKRWKCLCSKSWHECDKHCRAGEVVKRPHDKAMLKKMTLNWLGTQIECKKQFKLELKSCKLEWTFPLITITPF